MGALQFNERTGSIEITYGGREAPFMGLDSSAPDPYIDPRSITKDSYNVINIDNSLRIINFQSQSDEIAYTPTSVIIGIGDLLGALFTVSWDTGTKTLSVYTYPDFPNIATGTLVGTINLPNLLTAPELNTLAYKNINGVCFFSFKNCPYILQHNNVSLNILTDYLGASYLNELNGRLVAADIFKYNLNQPQMPGSQTNTIALGDGTHDADLSFNASQYEFNGTSPGVLLRTSGGVGGGVLTDYIICTNFGSTVPSNAIIKGITCTFKWASDVNNGTGILKNIALYSGGIILGTAKSPGTMNTTVETSYTYGGPTDLWGNLAISTAVANGATFGFGVQVQTVDVGSTRSFFYSFTIKIDYILTDNFPPTTGTGGVTASATENASGTQTNQSSEIGGYASQVVAAGDQISVSFVLNGNVTVFPTNTGSGFVNIEYTPDNGVTWKVGQNFGSAGTTITFNNQLTQFSIPSADVAILGNLDNLQFRLNVSATGTDQGGCSSTGTLTGGAINYSPAGSTLPSITEYPYQFAWSAPTGQYGQFNPLDTNSLVTGAGFNNLPDVEDVITGYFNIGPTGYIIRLQGITEVSPLNSGINPFDFNHLWASHKGIGTIYPSTLAQYGSIGVFLSDTGIYTIGYEGINVIDNKAKSAIYQELILDNQAFLLCGGIGPLQIDGENFLSYMIAAQNSTTGIITVYAFNFNTKEWFKFLPNVAVGNVGIGFSAINNLLTSTSLNTLFLLTNPNAYSLNISGLPVTSSAPAGADLNQPLIIFSAEEIKFMRDISVDAVGVYYKCKPTNTPANLNAQFSINGTAFTQFDSNSSIFDGIWHYVMLYPVAQMFTGKTPQLKIQTNILAGNPVSMYFGKVVIFGSIDLTQRPA